MAKLQDIHALRYKEGTSDKVWGGSLIQVSDSTWALVTCWGKTGTNYDNKCDTLPEATARKQLDKKLAEKKAKGYEDIFPPAGDLAKEARHVGLRIEVPKALMAAYCNAHPEQPLAQVDVPTASTTVIVTSGEQGVAALKGPIPSHVQPLSPDDLPHILTDRTHGVQEKANGTRCLIVSDGKTLHAFNRRGVAQVLLPLAAQRLDVLLPATFILDGERLEGEHAGDYLLFDILDWDGQSLREHPYQERIAHLERVLIEAGLVHHGGATAQRAYSASQTPGLGLLTVAEIPSDKQIVFNEIMQGQGEGIIVRTLSGPSIAGDTHFERKFKLLADLDVIAWGISAGTTGSGSVRMGLLRPADHALIDVGKVRSGLNDREVERLAKLIDEQKYPVLQVAFLPIRTVGIQLVEPRAHIRTDKALTDCTTDQLLEVLDPARSQITRDLIARAQPVPGFTLLTEDVQEPPQTVSVAKAAQHIHTALVAAFPGVAFAVHRHKHTGAETITISWTDGPTAIQLQPSIATITSVTDAVHTLRSDHIPSKDVINPYDELVLSGPITITLNRTFSVRFLRECAETVGIRYKVRPPYVEGSTKTMRILFGGQRVEFGLQGMTLADKMLQLAQLTSTHQCSPDLFAQLPTNLEKVGTQ